MCRLRLKLHDSPVCPEGAEGAGMSAPGPWPPRLGRRPAGQLSREVRPRQSVAGVAEFDPDPTLNILSRCIAM